MTRPFDVYIDGEGYRLNRIFGGRAYQPEIQPQFLEQQGAFWTDWYQRSWHRGERVERILSKALLEGGVYHTAEGVNVSKWGRLTLQPALTLSLAVSSTTMPMTVSADGSTVFVGFSVAPHLRMAKRNTSTNVWEWTELAGAGMEADTTDLITVGSTYYGIQASSVVTSTNGTLWTVVEKPTSGNYTDAQALCYLNGDLYVLRPTQVFNHTQNEVVASWGGTVMTGYQENVYWGSDHRLWRYNGQASYLYTSFPLGFNITALCEYRAVLLVLGYFKVKGGYKGAVYYIVAGNDAHLYSLGDYSEDHRIYAATGADDALFIASPDRGGVDRYDLSASGLSSGPAWGSHGSIPFKGMAYADGALFVGRCDGVTATDGVYVCEIEAPAAWVTSGYLTTASWDFDYPTDLKVFKSIAVYHHALLSGESFKVEYSLDDGSTWKLAGVSARPASTSREFSLDNARAHDLKIKVSVAGIGSGTPELNAILARAVPIQGAKWQWTMELLVDKVKTKRGTGLPARLAAIYNSNDKGAVLSFSDLYGDTHAVVIKDLTPNHASLRSKYARIHVVLQEV